VNKKKEIPIVLGHKSLLTTVQFYGNLGAEDWLKKFAENVRERLFI